MFFDKKKIAAKAGVSLITVLLFMLIATIAATATWKWITSEGRSSASRMLQREAYQSSLAGIENARAWMTYHASDVGGIVSQFFENSNRPIQLTSVLRPLAKAGQTYDVWLTDVKTENNVYKMEILSSGQARNGSKHSEVAILNVTGLYQVKVPVKKHSSTTDFDYAYYGGGFHSTQVTVTSAAVNGNWDGNPPVVTRNWVVTGSATLDGNNVTVGGTACIGGNVTVQNNGFSTTNLYVGGNFKGLLNNASGDAYFEGKVKHEGTGSVNIGGSATLNGTLVTNQSASNRAFVVAENLCLSENAMVVSSGTSDEFRVDGNIWMPGNNNLWYGEVDGTECTCAKYKYECYYKSCTCATTDGNSTEDCKETDTWRNPTCETVKYTGACGAADANGNSWLSHTHKEKNPLDQSRNWYKLTVKKIRESGSRTCPYGDDDLISCSKYTNKTSEDNYSTAGKIILGNAAGSKAYIKTAYPSQDYVDNLYGMEFVEQNDHPRSCTTGIGCTDNWDGGSYHPYVARTAADELYYIYYMPEGTKSVDFGTYTDSDWHETIRGYFVNSSVNSQNTRYTNSSHTNDNITGATNIAGKGHYRLLNHTPDKITGSPYCGYGDAWRPECGVTPWFTSKGTVTHNLPSAKPFKCAEDVKDECSSMWTEGEGCEGSKYIINDPLVTAYDEFISYANLGCAANIKSWTKDGFDASLQSCYDENLRDSPDNLYNGYLVVDLTSSDQNYSQASTALTGKYIVVVENLLQAGQNGLLNVADGSYVFYYLKKGARYIQKDAKNSFIYTTGDIGESSGLKLTGTLYAPSSACARADLKDATLTYSPDLVQELMDAGIICNSDDIPCGGTITSSSSSLGSDPSSSASEESNGGYDTYHIATAPQLGISLVSQHTTTETNPSADAFDAIAPSVLVLPRIVYLPENPVGRLSDYYNIVNLNGATEAKEASNVTCSSGDINITGPLYQDGHKIPKGIYKCKYRSTQYGDNPFYIVVNGTSGLDPAVHFVTDKEEITSGTPVTVSLEIPAFSHGNIEVDVLVSSIPNGWTVTPQPGVELRGNSSGKIYKVTATPSATVTITKPLFTVSIASDADNGGVNFQLITPCEGCTIGSPNTEYVFMTGYADIVRNSLAQYCATYAEECASNGYSTKAGLPDCDDFVSGEWVKANGLNCRIKEPTSTNQNQQWSCGTNMAITLVGSSNIPSYCELIIPTEHNRIAQAEDGESYPLYASLKRKAYTLTVKKESKKGAISDNTKLNVFISSDGTFSSTPEEVCSDASCTYSVYAGYAVKVEYEEGGSDKFSYWHCSGTNCTSSNGFTSESYTIPKIEGNNTVTATFNDVDKHCFYEDFSGLNAFCTGTDTHCIANCNGSHCSVSSIPEEWQLIYSNGGNGNGNGNSNKKVNVPPNVNTNEGSISQGNVGNGNQNSSNGRQTVILSSKEAGPNGTMTALMTVPIAQNNSSNVFLNSGLIFRSNADASEYTTFSLYGSRSGSLVLHVCKDTDQGRNNSNGCWQYTSNKFYVTSNTHAAVQLTLNDNILTIVVTIGNQSETVSMDVSGYSSMENKYVGMKLSDDAYSLYDIGWQSSSYPSENCWDIPTVHCSFKANYLGGLVPMNTDVSPWVNISSWFTENNCTPDYFYNGSDNVSSQTSDANYGYKLASSIYNFTEEGAHGPDNKDAKVTVTCPAGVSTSLGANAISCESFWVGDLVPCTNNYGSLLSESYQASAGENTIDISTTGINMREATFFISIANLNNGGQVIVSLKDINGHTSLPSTLSINAEHSLDVEIMSNSDGFDPEHVVAIVVNGDAGFTVESARTTCPYALGLSNCSARYNGTSWVVSANINNVAGAKENGCLISVDNTNIDVSNHSELTCPSDGVFTIPDAGFYERLNEANSTQEVTFTITAKNLADEDVSCSATASYSPVEITCSVASETAVQGQGVPTLSYSIANCPSTGCPYTLSLSTSPATTAEGSQSGSSDTWTPPVNTMTALSAASYSYTIESMGKSKNCGSFTVVEASAANVTSCAISNGIFTANITPANDGSSWAASFAVADAQGNIISGSTQNQTGTATSWEVTLPTMAQQSSDVTYYVNMTLNGIAVEDCSPSWTIAGSGNNNNSDDNDDDDDENNTSSTDVTCSITTATVEEAANSTSQAMAIPASSVTVNNCDATCKYTVMEGTTAVSDATTYSSGYDLGFNGATGTGPHTYTVSIQRGSETAVTCSGSYTVDYKGSSTGTCEKIDVNMTNSNHTVTGSLQNGCATISTNRICTGGLQIEIQSCKGKSGTWNGVPFTLNDNNDGYYQFTSNPVLTTTNRLEVPDCPSATIRKVYMDNCTVTGTLQNNKMTEMEKIYTIPKSSCADVDIAWTNSGWIPTNIALRCLGDEGVVPLSISNMKIQYSNVCAGSSRDKMCSVVYVY